MAISGFFLLGCAQNLSVKRKVSLVPGRVVIDAGHGGEDAGAVGARGLKEKDITLDIAKRLGRIFRVMMPKVEISFTRTNDSYVSLSHRVQRANDKKADIFVSLHNNSSESKDANGFEVYSLDIASDRHAERLAARENSAPKEKPESVNFILADLQAFSHRKDSDKLASLVSRGIAFQMNKTPYHKGIRHRGYNQAIFNVLFVKMPAILVELFFISNREEELLLSKANVREHIARGIFLGLRKFLEDKNGV